MAKKKKSSKKSNKRRLNKLGVCVPVGGQGKTTFSANPALMLAEEGHRVLIVDGCPSNQLSLYFNVDPAKGVHNFLEGEDLVDLLWEVRPNLNLLPAGDLVEAESILREDKVFPAAKLEELMKDWEVNFDFILFDTAPNYNTLLFFNILFYVDKIISPVETHRRGFDKLMEFAELLESKNAVLRERHNKSPLKIDMVIPNKHRNTRLNNGVLDLLQEEFGDVVTEPIPLCTGVAQAWRDSESLSERLQRIKSPRENELRILATLQTIVQNITNG